MLRLLYKCTRAGYPPEYLVSRIHGRLRVHARQALVKPGEENGFLANDQQIWTDAQTERCWLYKQMDAHLRQILAPMFVFYEINTLIVHLRCLESNPTERGGDELEHSLWAEGIRKIITRMVTAGEVVAKLERHLADSPLKLNGLVLAYDGGGIQGCEELIRRRFFEQVPKVCDHPALIVFFRMMIDLRNILTMAKFLRWDKLEPPSLIEGGHLRARRGVQEPSEADLAALVQRFTGNQDVTAAGLRPVTLEPLLQEWLSRIMMRHIRSFCAVESCVGYIWHSFTAAKKRSAGYHTARFSQNFPKT